MAETRRGVQEFLGRCASNLHFFPLRLVKMGLLVQAVRFGFVDFGGDIADDCCRGDI